MPTFDSYPSASFALLSECLLALPRYSGPHGIRRAVPGDEIGFLDVYRFDSLAVTSTASSCIASFALPVLNLRNLTAIIRLQCAPTAAVPNIGTSSSSTHKVFDLAPNDRLLHLDIEVPRQPLSGPRRASFTTICIPSSVLLNILAEHQVHHTCQVDVPWVDWANKVSWVNNAHLGIPQGRAVFGQRIAAFDSSPPLSQLRLIILDFNQRRVNRTLADEQAVWRLVSKTPVGDNFKQSKEADFSGQEGLTSKYMKVVFPVGGAMDRGDTILIDDERGE